MDWKHQSIIRIVSILPNYLFIDKYINGLIVSVLDQTLSDCFAGGQDTKSAKVIWFI